MNCGESTVRVIEGIGALMIRTCVPCAREGRSPPRFSQGSVMKDAAQRMLVERFGKKVASPGFRLGLVVGVVTLASGWMATSRGFLPRAPHDWVRLEFVRHDPRLPLLLPGARWSEGGRVMYVPYDPAASNPAEVLWGVRDILDFPALGTNRPVLVDPGPEVPSLNLRPWNLVTSVGTLVLASATLGTVAGLLYGSLSRASCRREAIEAGVEAARRALDEFIAGSTESTVVRAKQEEGRMEPVSVGPSRGDEQAQVFHPDGATWQAGLQPLLDRVSEWFHSKYGRELKLLAGESERSIELRSRYEAQVAAAASSISDPASDPGLRELTDADRVRGSKALARELGIPRELLASELVQQVEAFAARVQRGSTVGWILHGPTGSGKTKVLRALPSYFAEDDRGVQHLVASPDWYPTTVCGSLDPARFQVGLVPEAILKSMAGGGLPWVRIDDINRLPVAFGVAFAAFTETVFRRSEGSLGRAEPRRMEVLLNNVRTTGFVLPLRLRLLMTRNPVFARLCETGCLPADFAGRVTEVELRPLSSESERRLLGQWLAREGLGFSPEWSLRGLEIPKDDGWLDDLCTVAAACRPSCHPKRRLDESWKLVEPGVVTLRSLIIDSSGVASGLGWDERLTEEVDQRLVAPVARTIGSLDERHHFADILKGTRFHRLAGRFGQD